MRIAVGTALLLAATACTGEGDTDTPSDTTDTTFVDATPPTEDTGWPPGELGNLQIAHHVNDGSTRVYGLFTVSSPAFVNLAQCALEGSVCLTQFPDEDEFEVVDPDQDVEHEAVSTVFTGFEVTYGPYTVPYVEEPETGFGSYSADVTGQDLPLGWIGVTWGGSWKAYEGTEDLYVSPPIELIAPAPDAHIRFENGDLVVVEWVPTGEGEVTITVAGEASEPRIFNVEDDGYYAFDVDTEFGLTNDTEEVGFSITRWNRAQLLKYGHVVDLAASSDASFTGTYNNIGARVRMNPADQCAEAQGLAPLETGGYWGLLDPLTDDMDPVCVNESIDSDARGKDGFFRIQLDPYESVAVDYNTYDPVSASVYLLEDCNDEDSCIDGADLEPDPNMHEFVNYFNNSDDIQTVYLGVDSTDSDNAVFTVDLTVTPIVDPEMYDYCVDAKAPTAQVTSATSSFFEPFTAYTGDLNPGVGGCTLSSLPGTEAIMPIEIQPADSVTVFVTMAGGDPGVYLLYDCANAFLCGAGGDLSLGPNEGLEYTNNSADVERLYLVVDSKSGLHPFFLSINFGP
jgi:hypothetical protein